MVWVGRKRYRDERYPGVSASRPRYTGAYKKTASRTTRGYVPSAMRGYYRQVGRYGRYQPGGPERKNIDGNIALATVGGTGTMTVTLNPILQGNDPEDRISRKCCVKTIQIRGEAFVPSTATAASVGDRLRMILYLDKQCNGISAVPSDILAQPNINSFLDLDNSGRFEILVDRTWDLNGGAGDGTNFAPIRKTFNIYKKVNIPLIFSGATGAVADIASNNIGILWISSNGVVQRLATTRLRFTDY